MRVKKANERGAWALRPGDLPPESVLALEPRLRGAENNPVFRVLVWRDHLGLYGKESVRRLGWVIFVGGFVAGGLTRNMFFMFVPMYSGLFLAIWPGLLLRKGRGALQPTALSYIPDNLVEDLHQAGADYETFLSGLWASSVRRRGRNRRLSLALIAMVVLTMLLLLARPSGPMRLLVCLGILFSSAEVTAARYPTYTGLQRVVAQFAYSKANLLRARAGIRGCLSAGAALAGVVIMRMTGATAYLDSPDMRIIRLLIVSACSCGAIAGWTNTFFAHRRKIENLKVLEGAIGSILNRVTAKSSENPFPSGKPKDDLTPVPGVAEG